MTLLVVGVVAGLIPGAAYAQDGLAAGGGFADHLMRECRTDTRTLNQVSGWATRWPGQLENARVGTAEEREETLSYWSDIPAALEGDMEALREGMGAGTTAPRAVVLRVLEQVDGLLALRAEESPFWSPARRSNDTAFSRAWRRAVEGEWLPAVRRYREFLGGEYLEAARTTMGLGATPGGDACFAHLIEAWTSLPMSPAEVEAAGHRKLAELRSELMALASPEYGATFEDVIERLREGPHPDPFESREDVLRHARSAVARAEASVHAWVGSPGNVPIEVVAMPRYMESSFPAGYYRPATDDRPAAYVVNTSRPAERRLLSEAIAFHETIPGHHTHFSARRGTTGPFVSGLAEGWAIYAEGLADEMGLYSSRLDRIGRVAKHLWAASRLVVEPGLHVHGWSRDDAIRFMLENTALPRSEIEVEVDRYPALPGQSLGYMLGNLHLRALRTSAEARLGGSFDIRTFHDVILTPGMRPLPDVADDVVLWVAKVASGEPFPTAPLDPVDDAPAPPPGPLAAVAFMAGTWCSEAGGGTEGRDGETRGWRMRPCPSATSRSDGGSTGESAARMTLLHPGLISTARNDELTPAFSPDGDHVVFVRREPEGTFTLYESRRSEAGWSTPWILPFSGTGNDQAPTFSPDGRWLYFQSRRSTAAGPRDDDLWRVPVEDTTWGEPRPVPAPVRRSPAPAPAIPFEGREMAPSVAADGSLLYWSAIPGMTLGQSDLYIAPAVGDGFGGPRNLGPVVNSEHYETHPWISPDGSYLLFACDFCPNGIGDSDVYVTRRTEDGWSPPVSLGTPVNSGSHDFGARVSADGRWLFVTSNRPVPGWSGPQVQNIWRIGVADVPALAFIH